MSIAMRSNLLPFLAAVTLAGCRGAPPKPDLAPMPDIKVVRSAPAWYLKAPVDADYVLVPATATSRDLQVAIDKAQLAARAGIATQMEAKLEVLGKRFSEESGASPTSELIQSYSAATKVVVSSVLNGSRPRDQQIVREGDIYRAYVLMELPIGRANAELVQRLRANEQNFTRLRATQAFKDLERDVMRYEAAKAGTP